MTVSTFLTRVRVMAAAELLSSSDATVATIAGQVGYQSEIRILPCVPRRGRYDAGALSAQSTAAWTPR